MRDGRPRRAVERVTGGSRDRLGLYTALGMGDGRCYERGRGEIGPSGTVAFCSLVHLDLFSFFFSWQICPSLNRPIEGVGKKKLLGRAVKGLVDY